MMASQLYKSLKCHIYAPLKLRLFVLFLSTTKQYYFTYAGYQGSTHVCIIVCIIILISMQLKHHYECCTENTTLGWDLMVNTESHNGAFTDLIVVLHEMALVNQ